MMGGVVLSACLALAAPAPAANTAVDLNLFSLNPADITIDQGDTVTWRWIGADKNHDVVSYPGEPEAYDSHPGIPALDAPPGGTFAHTFTTVGVSRYFCSNHSNMQGTVTVRAAAAGAVQDGTAAEGAPAGQLAKPKGCISKRNFRIRLRQPRGSRLRSATVTLNGRPVPVARGEGGRLTAPVDLRGFSTGTYEVKIKARTVGGRTLTGTRRYRTCAPKLADTALPPL
jgi:plastocyanin